MSNQTTDQPAKGEIGVTLAEDRGSLRLTMTKGDATMALDLNADESLALIHNLIASRAGLSALQLQGRPEPGQGLAYPDPYYYISRNDITPFGGVKLDLYVPGLGWMVFLHPPKEAERMMELFEQNSQPETKHLS